MPQNVKIGTPILFLFLCLLVFGWSISGALAQNPAKNKSEYLRKPIEKQPFDKEKWKKTTKGMTFTEKKEVKPPPQKQRVKAPSVKTPGISGGLIQGVLILLILGVLVFLLIKIFGNAIFSFDRSIKTKGVPSLDLIDEENINLSELEQLLQRALAAKEYRLAVRIYYLMIIKSLNEKELIRWKKDKTNREYLREMSQHPLFQGFREATSLFEVIWYGEVDLQEKEFTDIRPKFTTLIQQFKV